MNLRNLPYEIGALACHPVQSEGSQSQILRYARNDKAGRLPREVYECFVA